MMNKNEFTNIAKKIVRFQKGLRDRQIIHPSRDWFIGLLIMLLIFGASASWSASTYLKYKNTAVTTGAEGNNNVVVYRESLVSAALETFKEKQILFLGLTKTSFTPAPETITTTETEDTATSTESSLENQELNSELILGTESSTTVLQEESPVEIGELNFISN